MHPSLLHGPGRKAMFKIKGTLQSTITYFFLHQSQQLLVFKAEQK